MYSPRNAFLILGQPLCGKIQTRADCHLYSIQNEVRLMGLSPTLTVDGCGPTMLCLQLENNEKPGSISKQPLCQ